MDETSRRERDQSSHTWSVRVSGISETESKVYAGKNAFSVGKQAEFTGESAYPTAVEYLLGALGGDLVNGFRRLAEKRGITVEAIESVVSGRLDNPLVFLGVVGAEGSPGLGSIAATVYVSADAEQSTLREVWRATLEGSPLVRTLQRSTTLSLSMQPTT